MRLTSGLEPDTPGGPTPLPGQPRLPCTAWRRRPGPRARRPAARRGGARAVRARGHHQAVRPPRFRMRPRGARPQRDQPARPAPSARSSPTLPHCGRSHSWCSTASPATSANLDLNVADDFLTDRSSSRSMPRPWSARNAPRKWQGEHIAMGTNVDVYQRAEGKYQLTPRISAPARCRNPLDLRGHADPARPGPGRPPWSYLRGARGVGG